MAHSFRESGFTLLELLVTLTVASILLAVAIPTFRTLTASTRLTTQANDLVGAINLARSEAVKRNTSIELCRTDLPTSAACATESAPWANWMIETTGGSVIRRGTIDGHNGAIVVDSTLTSDQLQFSSDGLASTGGVLVVSNQINVCATNVSKDNIRHITVGRGSHIFTTTASGGC